MYNTNTPNHIINHQINPINNLMQLQIPKQTNSTKQIKPPRKNTFSSNNTNKSNNIISHTANFINSNNSNNFNSKKTINSNKHIITSTIFEIEKLEKSIFPMDLGTYICTYKGCKEIQKIVKKYIPELSFIIIERIQPKLKEVMLDQYANYFFQKLIENVNSKFRTNIYKLIKNNFKEISEDLCGTHSLQALVVNTNDTEEIAIISEIIIANHKYLCYDPNSAHIIQRVFSSIDESKRANLNESILEDLNSLVLNTHGVCIAKKFLKESKSYKSKVIQKIIPSLLEIIQSPFGNYFIQFMMDMYPLRIDESKDVSKNIKNNENDSYSNNDLTYDVNNNNNNNTNNIENNNLDNNLNNHHTNDNSLDISTEIPQVTNDILTNSNILMHNININNNETNPNNPNNNETNTNSSKKQDNDMLPIYNIILSNCHNLICLKHSSNVVEKCLESSTQSFRRKLNKVLFSSEKLNALNKSKFAKTVLQKCIFNMTKNQAKEILENLVWQNKHENIVALLNKKIEKEEI